MVQFCSPNTFHLRLNMSSVWLWNGHILTTQATTVIVGVSSQYSPAQTSLLYGDVGGQNRRLQLARHRSPRAAGTLADESTKGLS